MVALPNRLVERERIGSSASSAVQPFQRNFRRLNGIVCIDGRHHVEGCSGADDATDIVPPALTNFPCGLRDMYKLAGSHNI